MKLKNFLILGFALLTSTVFYSCKPSDTEVQTAINEVLKAKPELAGISATVTDGVATLTGQVSDATLKSNAEEAIKAVKGLKSVTNNITVEVPEVTSTTNMADDLLTKSVNDAIKDFEGVSATVEAGVISLTGTIEKSKLPTLMQALNALSPKSINNQLTVK